MIEFRSFLNTDSSAIVDIWRKQRSFRCISTTMTRDDLEQMILGKPYFDPDGLILAVEDGKPIGFVHAGFGPDAHFGDLDHTTGIICQLRITDVQNIDEVSYGLIHAAMSYLKDRGAKVCFAGSCFPHEPFYMGFYGGSRIPGVPDEDELMTRAFTDYGFQRRDMIYVTQRRLSGFRAIVDRQQMTVRRQYQISPIVDPLPSNWWESCTFGWHEIFGFRLMDRKNQKVVGCVMFWEIQPLSTEWGTRTMGLCDLKVQTELQRQGLATFLIGESLRQLALQGVSLVELQYNQTDEAMHGIAQKLGFERISHGFTMFHQI